MCPTILSLCHMSWSKKQVLLCMLTKKRYALLLLHDDNHVAQPSVLHASMLDPLDSQSVVQRHKHQFVCRSADVMPCSCRLMKAVMKPCTAMHLVHQCIKCF